ncbi:MAG: DegT/DnrJ/EryC1/StrS family aminotransferase [Deltaproteobacteria bacterium]|nr:DegT/DnrJ/EryC1/StrS family aminotransferase [Deltaproteobacteria bacterium]
MSAPDLTQGERSAVSQVLTTPHLALGPQLVEFEKCFSELIGPYQCVGVSSGTAGLHLAVIAADVKDGDLVITTPFSFIASANCILYERGFPIFVDVDPRTGNLDPNLVQEAAQDLIQGGVKARRWLPASGRANDSLRKGCLKAILPVHAFGQPADMDPLLETARRHGLVVIEDACEALGSEYKGRKAGCLGDIAVFAFYPNKQITTGEGGMIVTASPEWEALFRSLRNQGRDVFDAWLNHSRLGFNYRLDEMSAALGVAQLARLDEILQKREQVAGWYGERLADLELVEVPFISPYTTRMSWFVYVVRLKPPASRERVMSELQKAGIPSRPYFTPIHLQPFYRKEFGYREGDFPVTEYLGNVSLALPFSGVMTETQVDYVCEHLGRSLTRY